jgi:hypothetical protein
MWMLRTLLILESLAQKGCCPFQSSLAALPNASPSEREVTAATSAPAAPLGAILASAYGGPSSAPAVQGIRDGFRARTAPRRMGRLRA